MTFNVPGMNDPDEAEAIRKDYSYPIAQLAHLTEKPYAYQRDGSIDDPLEAAAVQGAHEINAFLMSAPALNRQGRFEEQEAEAERWMGVFDSNKDTQDKKAEDQALLQSLLNRWSAADSFMLQAKIIEDQRGIEYAENMMVKPFGEDKSDPRSLYDIYEDCVRERDQVELESVQLPPSLNMYFGCRLEQQKIMREQRYDLAMGHPTLDLTEVKRDLAKGKNIHDLFFRMPWAFELAYNTVMASMLDRHRPPRAANVPDRGPAPSAPYAHALLPTTRRLPGNERPGRRRRRRTRQPSAAPRMARRQETTAA